MAKAQVKIPSGDWQEIAPETLPDNVAKLYKALQNANAAARKARDAFELAFSEAWVAKGKLPKERNAKFGYYFGKLSVADPAKHNFPRVSATNGTKRGPVAF